MTSNSSQPRNLNIDFIRIAATVMILTAHVTALIYARPDFFGSTFWWLNHIVLSFCRLGTPLFFMVSGYLVGDKKRSGKKNFQHVFWRLGVPFLSFYVLSNIIFSAIHSTQPFSLILTDVFTGGGNYLYFLIGLIFLYLINPYLQRFTQNLSQKEFKYLLIFFLANTSMYEFGEYFLSLKGEVHTATFLYWFLTLGFFLYGCYLKKFSTNANFKKDLPLFVAPIFLNIILTFAMQRLFLQTSDVFFLKQSNYFQSYLGATVILASLFLFKFLLFNASLKSILKKHHSILTHFAQNAFGIYLVHMIVLEYFLFRTPLTVDNGPFNPAIMIAAIWGTLLICSYLVSEIGGRLPVLKYAFGNTK